jgi:hypothetical protein
MQPKAWEALTCLLSGNWRILDDEPTGRENFFSNNKQDLDRYGEDELEFIIDDQNNSRPTSMNDFSMMNSALQFENPLQPDLYSDL